MTTSTAKLIFSQSSQNSIPATLVDAKWLFQFQKQGIIAILSNRDQVLLLSIFRPQILLPNKSLLEGFHNGVVL